MGARKIHYSNGSIEKGRIQLEPKRDGVKYKKPDVILFKKPGSADKLELVAADVKKVVFTS